MKISVIVPTYKPQEYLWECLDSIYNQTFPKSDYELLLVLNGCNEPHNTQIMDWISKHPDLPIQYFQIDEGGVSNARNIALDNAIGEYVTFIDDDDLISPVYLEELYEKVSEYTVALCYPYAFKDGNIKEQLSYTMTKTYNYCIENKNVKLSSRVRKYFSGPCMKLIPMSFIQGRRYNVRFKNGEDSLFMFLISNKINKVTFTTKKAIYYRRVRTNSAATVKRSFKDVFNNSCRLIIEYTKIYFSQLTTYNLYFYITRVLGSIKAVICYRNDTF